MLRLKSKSLRCTTFVTILIYASTFSGASIASIQYPSNASTILAAPDIGEIIQQINATTLATFVQAIQDFGPHPTGSPAISQVQQYLVSQLSITGLTIQQIPWWAKLYHGVTIEATLPGTGSAGNILILCAHYDSIRISPGADDDGSGTAAVLTTARVLSHYQFNCTVRFMFFSGEEQGILGSGSYAMQARRNHENIIGVIALDGVGYSDPTITTHIVWNNADASAHWIVPHSQAIAMAYPDLIPIEVVLGENRPDSDHQSFLTQGYAAECFREETLDPFYHTSDDTIGHMNLSYLTDVCRLAAGTIASLAGMNRRLSSDQLALRLQGSSHSKSTLCSASIENAGYQQDTANLSVQVALKNRKTGADLRTPRNISMNWTLTPEVRRSWEFQVGEQRFENQRVVFTVTVTGQRDDEGLYQHLERAGIIIFHKILLLTH